VVYDSKKVFRICAETHLEMRHGSKGVTARVVGEKYVGINFDEVVWVVEHCRQCGSHGVKDEHQARSSRTSRRERKTRRRERACPTAGTGGSEESTAIPQQHEASAPNSVALQGHLYNPLPTVRILVEVVDMGPKFVAGFRHALLLQDTDYRVALLSALPAANDPAIMAQGIASWAQLRGAPTYARFALSGADAGDLATETLRLLRERHNIDCQRDTVPLPLALPSIITADVVRGGVMAWLQHNGPAAWDVVLRGVTFELNQIARPGAWTTADVIRHLSGMTMLEPSDELMAGIEAMTIRGGDGV
jgi:hypothetical protein